MCRARDSLREVGSTRDLVDSTRGRASSPGLANVPGPAKLPIPVR
jgi:hypothetical protein